MYPLAHLGIGATFARQISRTLPIRWLLVGTLLPDLIDKPVFFALGLYARFDHGGWVPGKRGFAHTLLFLLLLHALARLFKKRAQPLNALVVGAATHQALDVASKAFVPGGLGGALTVLVWPALGSSFPVLPAGLHGEWAITFEVLGALLLTLLLRKRPRL